MSKVLLLSHTYRGGRQSAALVALLVKAHLRALSNGKE